MSDISALLSQISAIKYGFGSKEALLPESLQTFSDTLPQKKQVHGTRIVDVVQSQQACGEADGFYTETPGILLTVFTADCLPIIFSHRAGKAVAVVHAGWRGLLNGIIEQMAARINRHSATQEWVASVGPAAGCCCYEVSEELVDSFINGLDLPPSLISPTYRHLDLAAIARAKLTQAGFAAIDSAGSCTICTCTPNPHPTASAPRFKYTSFRRNSLQRAKDPLIPGISGRNQQSGIIILPR